MGLTDFFNHLIFNKMKVAEKTNGAVQGNSNKLAEIKPAIKNPNPLAKTATAKSKETSSAAENEKAKPALNLESTLQLVADLHQRSEHRGMLLKRISELEAFEIILRSEREELESNHFQGCQLVISDDKGRTFATKTSGLITLVSSFIRQACVEKLAEIEAHIVLPRS